MHYPYLVLSAWDIVNKLITDWQREPYRWERERDIQVELSSRLSTLYSLIGHDTLEGRYKGVIEGYKDRQLFSRVSCEPYVKYQYKDGKEYRCHPDVVIWDEIKDPNLPPEDHWPILWACEIKYSTGKPSDWDIEKLEYLVSQSRIKFGCWLTLRFQRAVKGSGITWVKNKLGKKLWTCEAFLPPYPAS